MVQAKKKILTKEKTSARLRATLELANMMEIRYDSKRYFYGGFFSTWQIEQMIDFLKRINENIKSLQQGKA